MILERENIKLNENIPYLINSMRNKDLSDAEIIRTYCQEVKVYFDTCEAIYNEKMRMYITQFSQLKKNLMNLSKSVVFDSLKIRVYDENTNKRIPDATRLYTFMTDMKYKHMNVTVGPDIKDLKVIRGSLIKDGDINHKSFISSIEKILKYKNVYVNSQTELLNVISSMTFIEGANMAMSEYIRLVKTYFTHVSEMTINDITTLVKGKDYKDAMSDYYKFLNARFDMCKFILNDINTIMEAKCKMLINTVMLHDRDMLTNSGKNRTEFINEITSILENL